MTEAVKTNHVSVSELVDRYAEIHSQLSALTEQANELKAQLIATGESRIKGTFVSASITVSAPRVTTDYKGLVEELNPPAELISAYVKVGNPVTSVRLYGL